MHSSSVTEGSCLLHWGQPDTGLEGSGCSVTCHTKCTCLPGQRVTGQQETAGLGKHLEEWSTGNSSLHIYPVPHLADDCRMC